jgi:hypothetical protein
MWSWKVIKHYWHSFTQENRLCKQFVIFLYSILICILVFSRPSFPERNFADACWPSRRPLPPLHLPPSCCVPTLSPPTAPPAPVSLVTASHVAYPSLRARQPHTALAHSPPPPPRAPHHPSTGAMRRSCPSLINLCVRKEKWG